MSVEHRAGRLHEGLPLFPLHVDPDDETLAAVPVVGNLIGEGVELLGCRLLPTGAEALGVERRVPLRAGRPARVEAVVLVHRHAELHRHLAAPVVSAPDAVGVRGFDPFQQVLAHQKPAVVRASEAAQRAVLQSYRPELGEQGFPDFTFGQDGRRIGRPATGRGDSHGQCGRGRDRGQLLSVEHVTGYTGWETTEGTEISEITTEQRG